MLNRLIPIFVLIALLCAAHSAAAQDYAEERAEAVRRGLLLYEFDSSAWVATDALRDKKSAWKLYTETAKPKGWVTTEVGEGRLMTAFVAELNGEIVSVFDAVTKGRKVKKKTTYPLGRALTDQEALQLHAKAALPLSQIEPCRDLLPMNTIAIPTGQADEVFVYLMSSTQKSNEIVFGRHYRFKVRGDQLVETVKFSNSCLTIPKAPNGVGAVVSHVLTPYPQEHHVFAALSHDLPVYVTIPKTGTLWKIEDRKITPVEK
jgi:hypothetical protein